jgi:hypothetical protein
LDYTQPKDYEIGGIKVTGAEFSDENAVISIAGFKVGDNYFYGLGRSAGSGSVSYYKDLWKYDITLNTWEQVGDFTGEGRLDMSTVTSINGEVYAAFGRQSFDSYYDDVYKFKSSTDSWEFVTNYPNGGLYSAGMFTLDNHLFVVGGRNPAEQSDVFKYDITNNTWSADISFPEQGELEIFQNDQFIFGLSERKIYQYNNGNWTLVTEINGFPFTEGHISGDDLILVRRQEIAKLNLNSLDLITHVIPYNIATDLPFGKSFIHNDFLYIMSANEETIWKAELSKL